MEKIPVKVIVTHAQPHSEELAARWALKRFGTKKYPGVATARWEFWGEGGRMPANRKSREEYEAEGYLFVGCCGSKLDEHQINCASNGECSFTLTLKDLELDQDPALFKLAEIIKQRDNHGGESFLEIGNVCKAFFANNNGFSQKNFKDLVSWVEWSFDVLYENQKNFFSDDTINDFEKGKETKIKIQNSKGHQEITVLTIQSDNPNILRFALSHYGEHVGIIIQQNSSGNVQIFTHKKYRINLKDVCRALRVEEQKIQKKPGGERITDWEQLELEGKLETIPEWYYHQEGQMLLNGSSTHPNVPATQIPLERIKELVIWALTNYYPKEFNVCCQHGTCKSSINKKCPIYQYGFFRCRAMRFHELYEKKQPQK